jgi:dienelactone hydrolase
LCNFGSTTDSRRPTRRQFDAGHAFHADYRPTYRKDAADDGWKRMQARFKQHGV